MRENYDGAEIVNVGTGSDITIGELAQMIKEVVGYDGEIVFDATKPDGTPRKLVDVGRITALGWRAEMGLGESMANAYQWLLGNVDAAPDQVRGLK